VRKEIFPSDSYCPKQQKIQNKKTQMNEAVILQKKDRAGKKKWLA